MRPLTEADREILDRKQAARDADARRVEQGERTWAEVNRENGWASSVAADYRPVRSTRGLPR